MLAPPEPCWVVVGIFVTLFWLLTIGIIGLLLTKDTATIIFRIPSEGNEEGLRHRCVLFCLDTHEVQKNITFIHFSTAHLPYAMCGPGARDTFWMELRVLPGEITTQLTIIITGLMDDVQGSGREGDAVSLRIVRAILPWMCLLIGSCRRRRKLISLYGFFLEGGAVICSFFLNPLRVATTWTVWLGVMEAHKTSLFRSFILSSPPSLPSLPFCFLSPMSFSFLLSPSLSSLLSLWEIGIIVLAHF